MAKALWIYVLNISEFGRITFINQLHSYKYALSMVEVNPNEDVCYSVGTVVTSLVTFSYYH